MQLITDLYRDLRNQKVRALSTILGIAWGTLSVVLLMAFGTSIQAHMLARGEAIGNGIAIVWPQRTTVSHAGYPKGRQLRLTDSDALTLAGQIPELDLVSPEFNAYEQVRRGSQIHGVTIAGIYPAYSDLRVMDPQPGGRFINDADINGKRRVAFLGNLIKQNLFGNEPAVGRRIVLRGSPFTVIGVMVPKDQDSDYGGLDEYRVCIPATAHAQVFGRRYISNFVYRARSTNLHEKATQRVYEVLGSRLGFDPKDYDALNIWDTNEQQQMMWFVFFGMNLMFGFSGAFTLLVGGIGIGNLMFILVRQRTREIGIKMAVGARPSTILTEVLGQTLVLVSVGGILGFGFSITASYVANLLPIQDSIGVIRISPTVALGTIALLSTIGLIAGYFPARRASRIDPVLALA